MNGIGGLCAQGTIYCDNTMQAIKHDVAVGNGSGTNIYDANITRLSNLNSRIELYSNVNGNSYALVVAVNDHHGSEDESNTHDTINDNNNDIVMERAIKLYILDNNASGDRSKSLTKRRQQSTFGVAQYRSSSSHE